MKRLLSIRPEYQQYVNDCLEVGEVPVSFRVWFESAYYYDLQDDIIRQVYGDITGGEALCLN